MFQNETQLRVLMILSISTLVAVVYYLNSNAIYLKQTNVMHHPNSNATYQKQTKVIHYSNSNATYLKQTEATAKLEFDTSKVKKRYLLTVGVLSKPSAKERRMAIRKTWFNVCKDNKDKVLCKFFTDFTPENERSEQTEFKDLEYMPYKGK